MKTKIGEVKSIEDFFKKVSEKQINTNCEIGFGQYEEIQKCLICGNKIKGLSLRSARYSSDRTILDEMATHIELHRIVKSLKL